MAPRKERKTKHRLMLEDAVRRTATWCQANFPPRVEVVVSVVGEIDDETLGFVAPTNDEKTKVELLVSADQSVREAIETTIHEWAHVHTLPWLADWQNDHEDWFWLVFGRMYRRWHDQGGAQAAARL
jgi:hypothetical protein